MVDYELMDVVKKAVDEMQNKCLKSIMKRLTDGVFTEQEHVDYIDGILEGCRIIAESSLKYLDKAD